MWALASGGVLLQLPRSERDVFWRERVFRQTLAWYIQSLQHLGVQRIVLGQPPAAPWDSNVAGLWRQVRDLGRTYKLPVLEVVDLSAETYWQTATTGKNQF